MLTHRAALCGGSAAAGAAGYVAKGVKAAGKGLKYAKGLKNSTKLAKTGKAAKATVKGSSKFFKAVSKIGSKGDDLIRGIRAGAGKMKIVASGAKRYADDAVRIVTNGVAKGGDTVVSAFKAAGKKFASVAKSNVGKIDDAKDAGKRIIGLADDLDNYDYLQSNKVLDEIEDGLRKGSKSGSNTHVPSANTQVVRHPEIKSPNQVKKSDVTNYWDDYLGSNQTNIHPRTGLVDNDRIFSADGTKSIRFGNHEMDSMGTTKFHFHLEEWKYDPVNDVMEYFNTLVRIKR